MPLEPKPLPDGVHFTDVLEAAQAAWLARDYELARDLIRSFIDPNGEFCCMRCTKMCEDEPWAINNHLGKFRVCPDCATIVSTPGELLANGGEMYVEGPSQKVSEIMETYKVGDMMTIKTTTSRAYVKISKK